jgi:hypothetical protein
MDAGELTAYHMLDGATKSTTGEPQRTRYLTR